MAHSKDSYLFLLQMTNMKERREKGQKEIIKTKMKRKPERQ
jgi:hypothetical protein